MLIDLASMAALIVLAAVFGVFVSAVAMTAALWYIVGTIWTRVGGSRA